MRFSLRSLRNLNVIVGCGVSAALVAVKEYNTENVRKKLELKTDDKFLPVPAQLQALVNEVVTDMELEKLKIKITPYVFDGIGLNHTSKIFGSEIFLGIPQYFLLQAEISPLSSVVAGGKKIIEGTPDHQSLKDSMCLSKEAKKFGIAHEIFMAMFHRDVSSILLPAAVTILGSFCCLLLQIYTSRSKKPDKHLVYHGLILLFFNSLYYFLNSFYVIYTEGKSDMLAIGKGQSYVQGGIEHYNKMIKRNIFFKKVNKNAPYTEEGDIESFPFTGSHISLYRRVTYLTDISKSMS